MQTLAVSTDQPLEDSIAVAHKCISEAQEIAREILSALTGPAPPSADIASSPLSGGVVGSAQRLTPRLDQLNADLRRAHAMLTSPNVQGIAEQQYAMNNVNNANYGQLGATHNFG